MRWPEPRALLALAIALMATTAAAQAPGRFVTKEFELDAPSVQTGKAAVHQVAMFFLEPDSAFAASVNVQRQRFDGDADAYTALSVEQFKQHRMKVVQQVKTSSGTRVEYTGEANGRPMHFYARWFVARPYVYLVTATALESHWDAQKGELIRSVESFRMR